MVLSACVTNENQKKGVSNEIGNISTLIKKEREREKSQLIKKTFSLFNCLESEITNFFSDKKLSKKYVAINMAPFSFGFFLLCVKHA